MPRRTGAKRSKAYYQELKTLYHIYIYIYIYIHLRQKFVFVFVSSIPCWHRLGHIGQGTVPWKKQGTQQKPTLSSMEEEMIHHRFRSIHTENAKRFRDQQRDLNWKGKIRSNFPRHLVWAHLRAFWKANLEKVKKLNLNISQH